MEQTLETLIANFLSDCHRAGRPMSEWTFGYRAVKNGRLLERLKSGGDVTRKTEQRVRAFIEEQSKRTQEAA